MNLFTLLQFRYPYNYPSDSSDLWQHLPLFLICLAAIFFISGYISAGKKAIRSVHDHKHKHLDMPSFSPLQFYEGIETAIKSKAIDGVSFRSIKHSEGGLMSAKRIYFRISYHEYIFDVCAAPYGTEDFFISWWLGDSGYTLRDILSNIPVIGRWYTKRAKTFYEQDTETMFREMVVESINIVLSELMETKGMRLSEDTDWSSTRYQAIA